MFSVCVCACVCVWVCVYITNKNKGKRILYYLFLCIVINTKTTTWLKRNNHLFRNLTEWTFQISRYFLSWKKKIWLSGKFRDFTTNRSLLAQNISVIVIKEVRPHSPHGVSLPGIISTPDRINIKFYVQVVDSRDIPSRPMSIKPLDFIGSDLPFQHNVIHVVIKAEFPWTQVGPTANHIDTFRLSRSVVLDKIPRIRENQAYVHKIANQQIPCHLEKGWSSQSERMQKFIWLE